MKPTLPEGFPCTALRGLGSRTLPAQQAGIRVVFARTGLVVSPSGGLLSRLRPLFSLGLGARLGNGRQYMPWISLEDEVRALLFVMSHEVSGPVNLTGPAPVTNAEFTAAMGRAVNRPTPWLVPGFALRRLLGEFADEGLLGPARDTGSVGARWFSVPPQHDRRGAVVCDDTRGVAIAPSAGQTAVDQQAGQRRGGQQHCSQTRPTVAGVAADRLITDLALQRGVDVLSSSRLPALNACPPVMSTIVWSVSSSTGTGIVCPSKSTNPSGVPNEIVEIGMPCSLAARAAV